MNDQYWKKEYKKGKVKEPSPFFYFCKDRLKITDVILDFAAGDGRDTFALNKVCGNVAYIEPNNTLPFVGFENIKAVDEVDVMFTVIYARWAIHAVDRKTEDELIALAEKNGAKLMLEFRVTGDNPDNTHERRLINLGKFIEKLLDKNFTITYLKKGYGMSKVGKNDPLLARIVAECKGC